jgi:peptidylprolyl isomerase
MKASRSRRWHVVTGVTMLTLWVALVSPPTSAAEKLIAVKDHWHIAYGISICGKWQAPLPAAGEDPIGIHTHGDGLIHAHPFVEAAAGKNGVMKTFFDTEKISVTKDSMTIRGKVYKNNEKCDGKAAVVRTFQWASRDAKTPTQFKGDPATIPFGDQQMFAFVFGPADEKISEPPSKAELKDPSDLPPVPLTEKQLAALPAPPKYVPAAKYSATPPAKLEITDVVVGKGAEAVKGIRPYLRYTVAIWRTKDTIGQTGWTAIDQPELLSRLGKGDLLPGLEKGILGMKVGGIRQVTVPPSEGFGAKASGPIKPDDTLLFMLMLVDVKK